MTVTEVIQELGIPIAPTGHHHTTHDRVQIDCPWCSPNSQRWRLGIKTEYYTGWCNCWTCGPHRTAETLATAASVQIPQVGAMLGVVRRDFAPRRTLGAAKLVLPGCRGRLAPPHRHFLHERKFDRHTIRQLWKIDGISLHEKLSWRIFIPITLDGEVVSWTTRATNDWDIPYISAKPEEELVPHKHLLYGEDYCFNTIVIVEGPLDVWAIGPGAVCTFGTAYTSEQFNRMRKYPRRVVCYDAEPDAQRVAQKLCRELNVFDGETVNVVLETGKDASRAKKSEVKEIRKRFLQSMPT